MFVFCSDIRAAPFSVFLYLLVYNCKYRQPLCCCHGHTAYSSGRSKRVFLHYAFAGKKKNRNLYGNCSFSNTCFLFIKCIVMVCFDCDLFVLLVQLSWPCTSSTDIKRMNKTEIVSLENLRVARSV